MYTFCASTIVLIGVVVAGGGSVGGASSVTGNNGCSAAIENYHDIQQQNKAMKVQDSLTFNKKVIQQYMCTIMHVLFIQQTHNKFNFYEEENMTVGMYS